MALWKGTYEDLGQVDPTTIDVSERKVVYLPGRGQTDSALTELSKGVHFVEKIFNELEPADRPEVYIWSHADAYNKKVTGDVRSLAHVWSVTHLPYYSSAAAKELAQGLIMPMVTDETGKILSFEEAEKNLRKLTLLGYCLGSTTAHEMIRASRKMMIRAGYNRHDTRALLRKIVLVSFADFNDPKNRLNGCTTVAFRHSDDFFIGLKNAVVRPLSSLMKVTENVAANLTGHLTSIFASASEELTIKERSSSSIVVAAATRSNLYNSVLKLKQKADGVKLRGWKLTSNHKAKGYVTDDERNLFARMAKCALLNAVTRDRDVGPLALLARPTLLPENVPEVTDYYLKIAKGLDSGRKTLLDNLIHKRPKTEKDESRPITITSYQSCPAPG